MPGKKISLLLLVVAFIAVVNATPKDDDLVASCPMIPKYDHKWYSGYLNINSTLHMHYFLFESQSNPETDPLLIWLNGGPGCSSVLGALYENGPFVFKANSSDFQINEYSWNKFANVLYLESPAGVGWSYDDNHNPKVSDTDTAHQNLASLLKFYEKFPEYIKRPLYISGESYAGTYVPWFAYFVDAYNNNKTTPEDKKINLVGWAVGNGCTHPDECVGVEMYFKNSSSTFFFDFMYNQGKYSPELRAEYNNKCLNNNPNDPVCQELLGRIYVAVGLAPNNNTLNIYDIYGTCYNQSSEYGGIPPCSDSIGALNFTNNTDVQKALHIIPNTNNWTMCNDTIGNNYINDDQASYWIYEKLVGKYRVLIYSGDTDGAVPITGTLAWIEQLRNSKALSVVRPWSPWAYAGQFSDKQVGGFVEVLDNDFTFVSIRGAGHMVPQFAPQQAYVFMSNWIAGKDIPAF